MQTIKQGSRGAAVETAQRLLLAKGHSPGAADGLFGPKTLAATLAFQRAKGLTVDGIIGPKTWAALQGTGKPPHSAHFKLSEFACHDGTAVPQAYWSNVQRLMDELERVRAVWDKPIVIVSGYRTAAYNKGCGGATHSQHLTANAADLTVQGVAPSTVYAKLDALYPREGLGKYATFTHLDLRGYRARW